MYFLSRVIALSALGGASVAALSYVAVDLGHAAGAHGAPAPAVVAMVSPAPVRGGDIGAQPTAVEPPDANADPEQIPATPLARDCSDCPDLVGLPAGSFLMGSPYEEPGRYAHEGPRHRVSVGAFAIGLTEVTRGQFSEFVRDTGYEVTGSCYGWDGTDLGKSPRLTWRYPGFLQTDSHPVVCVGWRDAQAYVEWLSRKTGRRYRLPTEAEWEYAARARNGQPRYWNNAELGAQDVCRFANVVDHSFRNRMPLEGSWDVNDCDDAAAQTAPVGRYKPNAFGLYDMLGNVWEWVEDCWHDGYNGAPVNARAWDREDCPARVLRGGGWGDATLATDRAAARGNSAIVERSVYSGFRVARER